MNALKNIFVWLSGLFAVIPGLTVIMSNLGVPPDESKALYGGIIEAICCLCLLILWINRNRIRDIDLPKITRISIFTGLLFVATLIGYLFFYKNYVVFHPLAKEGIFFPLWTEGDLKKALLESNSSRYEIITNNLHDGTLDLISRSSSIPLNITSIVFLFLYQFVFTSLVFSFGILGIKTSEKNKSLD